MPPLDELRAGLTAGLTQGHNQIQTEGNCKTLIISDENILGHPSTAFRRRTFYPGTRVRCENLKKRLHEPAQKILFTIRPYAGYFPSVYALWLGDDRPNLKRSDACEQVLNLTRGWHDVVQDIKHVFVGAEIVVTEYSPQPAFIGRQFLELLGAQTALVEYDSRYYWNKKLPTDRLLALEALIAAGSVNQSDVDALRQQKLRGRSKPISGFWNDNQKTILAEKYASHLQQITETSGVKFIGKNEFATQ